MQSHTIIVHKPEYEDFPAIAEIKVRGWQTTYDKIVDKAYLQKLSVEQICDGMRENKKRDNYLVAEIKGEIIGFCRYRLHEGIAAQEDRSGAISELYVNPECKRIGVGKILFQCVMEDLGKSGCRSLLLSCFSENVSALAFYRKMNGEFVGKDSIEIDGKKYSVDCYRFAI